MGTPTNNCFQEYKQPRQGVQSVLHFSMTQRRCRFVYSLKTVYGRARFLRHRTCGVFSSLKTVPVEEVQLLLAKMFLLNLCSLKVLRK